MHICVCGETTECETSHFAMLVRHKNSYCLLFNIIFVVFFLFIEVSSSHLGYHVCFLNCNESEYLQKYPLFPQICMFALSRQR